MQVLQTVQVTGSVTHGVTHGMGVVSSQMRIGWHMIGFKLRPLVTNLKLESSLLVFPFHTNKVHLPLILVPPPDQFRHVFHRILIASMAPDAVPAPVPAPSSAQPGLRKITPYWYPYTTMAKGRWLKREILEIVSTEFRDRSVEYCVSVTPVRFAFVG